MSGKKARCIVETQWLSFSEALELIIKQWEVPRYSTWTQKARGILCYFQSFARNDGKVQLQHV